MGLARFLWTHVDAVVAVLLSGAFLGEIAVRDAQVPGASFIDSIEVDEPIAVAAGALFLLSLAIRRALPLVPLALAYVALTLLGRGDLDAHLTIDTGLLLATYSVGAWAGGRSGQLGALMVGGLVGLAVLRSTLGEPEPRDLALPVLVLVGAWMAGLAVRSVRAGRGDERVVGALDWESGISAPDSAGRDELVREIRDIVERAMSAVIIQARTARATLDREPDRTVRALAVIEAASGEALEETQRLTGLLLSPQGTPLPEPQPGLADLDYLAEHVTEAGLPVDLRVEGRPVALREDLDAVAYRVVHEALMSTLDHAASASSSVVVRYERDELQIEVVDDGVPVAGDDPDLETAGLIAVRNEVAALGGTLDAGPGDERGYWVLARLPYEPDWID